MASVGVRVEPTVRLVADARTHEFRPARYSHAALRLVQLMQETSPAWMRDVEGGQLVRRHSWGTCLRELFPRRTHRMCIQMNKCVLLWTLEERGERDLVQRRDPAATHGGPRDGGRGRAVPQRPHPRRRGRNLRRRRRHARHPRLGCGRQRHLSRRELLALPRPAERAGGWGAGALV